MASAEVRAFFAKMREDPENRICVDCGSNNPQWASVPFGVLFCLECAGTHRSLGVHIDFVRSVPMDSWSEKQLAHMRVGGNKKFKDFFGQQRLLNSSIKDRCSSPAAEVYKQMIKALSEGQQWTPPPGFSATPSSSSSIRTNPRQQSTPTTLSKPRDKPVRKPKAQPSTTDAWEDEWNDLQVNSIPTKYSSPNLVSSASSSFDQSRPVKSNSPIVSNPKRTNPSSSAAPRQEQSKPPVYSTRSEPLSASVDSGFRQDFHFGDSDDQEIRHSSSDSYRDDFGGSPPKPSYLLPSDSPLISSSSSSSSSSTPPLSLSSQQPQYSNETLLATGYDLFNKISTVAYNAASYSSKVASEKIETLSSSMAQPQGASGANGATTWDYVSSYLQTATDTIKQYTATDPRGSNPGTGMENGGENPSARHSKPQSFQIEDDQWFDNMTASKESKVSARAQTKPSRSVQSPSSGWDGFEIEESNDTHLDEGKNSGWDEGWDNWGNDLDSTSSAPKSRNLNKRA